MNPQTELRKQIVQDIENLATMEDLIESGETDLRVDRDRLECGIQIKVAILQGLEREDEPRLFEPPDQDHGLF